MLIGGGQQITLDSCFVLLGTRQYGNHEGLNASCQIQSRVNQLHSQRCYH
ncbi:unnamed protein product [Schistosoma margrebowiei]|uniref:Uncharacterized protein n=1 Tax=Schistosoma margrebowiei TaxID=48269 RepID=A0A183NCZ3_9TREM|nr:unnamed protein product [Schistosoma margrebowiei]